MKNISNIYKIYKIMPNLQEHQLRVTAVAKQICSSIYFMPLNAEDVINVCLLHDMGNIIKFDLNYFPEFLLPKGLEYWQKVKKEYIQKYGLNEHVATETICKEIGLSDIQMSYLKTIGFSKTVKVLKSNSLEQKICLYADQRVGPHGVLSVKDRLVDGKKRYEQRKDRAISLKKFNDLSCALKKIEKQIFCNSSIIPEDITDSSIKSIVARLKSDF